MFFAAADLLFRPNVGYLLPLATAKVKRKHFTLQAPRPANLQMNCEGRRQHTFKIVKDLIFIYTLIRRSSNKIKLSKYDFYRRIEVTYFLIKYYHFYLLLLIFVNKLLILI
jgi:hypothetical protein